MGYKVGATVLILGLAVFGAVQAQNSCRNPRGEYGSCINLKQCPQLLSILTGERKPADIEFLKASQCGFENRDPLVCCVPNSGFGGNGGNGGQNPPNGGNGGNGGQYPPNGGNGGNGGQYPPNGGNGGNGGQYPPNGGNGGNNGFNPNEGRLPTGPPNTNNGTGTNSLLPTDCGIQQSDRIVGGEATDIDEFPWMVLLEYSKPGGKTTACGGTLISKRYVLTAAHCLKGAALPSTWRLENVRLGEYNTATDPDCIPNGADGMICADPIVTVPIEEQIVHEQYEPQSTHQRNDIGLLRLSRDVSFTDYIRPVCMPRTATIEPKVTAAGWGKTEERSSSDIKLKVQLQLADKAACDRVYASYRVPLGDGQICAGGERGKDSCRGDSGGPLMQQLHDDQGFGRWYSVGVVSFGPSPCGMQNWPGVYTKVYDFLPWITSKLRA